jgi:molecular chaperone DnaK
MANDNKLLGNFDLSGIPPAPRGMPQIEVTFDIDANGLVHVNAKDKATGKDTSITVQSSGGLSKADIEKMVKDAERLKAEDEKRRSAIDTKNEADNVIYNIEKTMHEHKDRIPENVKNDINSSIQELKEKMSSDDVEGMRQAIEKIKTQSLEIGKSIYQGQARTEDNKTEENKEEDAKDSEKKE